MHRFEEFGKLSAAEATALSNISSQPVRFKKGATIRGENVVAESFYLLVDGWVGAAQTTPEGGRQILKIHLPGDAVGTPSMCMSATVEELTCLTDAWLIEVPFDLVGKLFEEHPRLAARFMLSVQAERVALMDRLAQIGRTNSRVLLAAFILDLSARLRPLHLVKQDSFLVMVTQQQIGDLLGLTGIHVNRMLHAFKRDGLIRCEGHRYSITDRPGLERVASRPQRTRCLDPAWLPAARQSHEP